MSPWATTALLLGGGLLGCTPVALPGLELNRVEPGFGYTGDTTPVTLFGRKFFPALEISTRTGESEFDVDYRAWLVRSGVPPHSLGALELTGFDRLVGSVPPGAAPGVWDVRLQGPTGRVVTLRSGYTVTDTKAARVDVALQSPAAVYPTGDPVFFDLEVRDFDDQPVNVPVDIQISAFDEVGRPVPESLATLNELENVRDTPEGDGLIGTMPEGRATIWVFREVPGEVELRVVPYETEPGIVGDSERVVFRAIDQFQLLFDSLPLPPTPEGFRAGEPIRVRARAVDALSRPVAEPLTLTLTAPCTFWVGEVVFDGAEPTEFEVVPQRRCTEDRIVEATGAARGESEPFAVVPGAASRFEIVSLNPNPVPAGDPVDVQVVPLDDYGNLTRFVEPLIVSAPDTKPEGLSCAPATGGGELRRCVVVPTSAGSGRTIEVRDEGGVRTGTRSDLDVVARPEPVQAELVVPSQALAGVPFVVQIQPYDRYGNPIDASGFGASAVSVSDDQGEVACVADVPAGTRQQLSCELFTSREGARLSVTFSATGAGPVLSSPFEVMPGPFSGVDVLAPERVVAGEVVSVEVVARDAFGNEVTPPMPAPVGELVDPSGTFTSGAVFLASSRVRASGIFERAGTTQLHFEIVGQPRGSSRPIHVEPAEAVDWEVIVTPWAFVGEASTIGVRARDAYGNTALRDAVVTVESETGGIEPLSSFVEGGVGQIAVVFGAATDFATVSLVDEVGLTGSASLPVVTACGDGPTARVALLGVPDDRICLDPGALSTQVTVDPSGSAAGGTDLDVLVVAVDGERRAWQSFPLLGTRPDVIVQGPGRVEVSALVVDDRLCADVAVASPWTGLDDGTPTGPLAVVSAASQLSDVDAIDVDLFGALDCGGQPVGFTPVLVRSSAGELGGVTPTGEGLGVLLDGQGRASVRLVTAGGLQDGPATVTVHTASGSAGGSLTLPLVGDSVRPVVVGQDPTGEVEEAELQLLAVHFSEPLDASTVVPGAFEVRGPQGAVPVLGADLVDDERTVWLDLGLALTDGEGVVTVLSDVSDVAGNRLEGAYDGTASAYDGAFTFASPPPLEVSCTPSTTRFRPDGDPGSGIDADEVQLVVDANRVPRWWIVDVFDWSGARVRHLRAPAGAASTTLSWDGRSQSGLVVGAGDYQVEVSAEDAQGARAPACRQSVAVEHGPRDRP